MFYRLNEDAMNTSFFPFNNKIHVGVVLGHLILVTVLGVSLWGLHQTVNSFESVSHSAEVTNSLFRLFLNLKEAEEHQRSFLLSGESDFLTSYRKVVQDIQDDMAQLHTVSLKNDPLDLRLQEFNNMLQKRLTLLQSVLDQFSTEGPPAVREAIIKGIGKNVMQEIQKFILNMNQEASTSLHHLHSAAHDLESLTIQTMMVGIVLTLIIGLITLWKLRQDLLDRQQLERRVLEEAKMAEVSRLIGDISHDIKNMLTPAQMGMNLLEEELDEFFQRLPPATGDTTQQTQALYKDVITMARRGTWRIQERVKEIADAVKGRSASPHFADCQLSEIIGNVLEALRLYGDKSGVSLQHQGLETLPTIRADQQRLFNAFYNLVNNAIPEVPAGGSITITGKLASDEKHILVNVKDTGRGMSSEVRDSLFTQNVVSRKSGGTGLGTKIVKDVVDVHGGTICVDSQEGQGTTFTVCLPKDGPLGSIS
jgi:signal transduction histidine kinase